MVVSGELPDNSDVTVDAAAEPGAGASGLAYAVLAKPEAANGGAGGPGGARLFKRGSSQLDRLASDLMSDDAY